MSGLVLRGFSIPGPTRPTFVIPYFGSPTSNQIYVQELDEEHRVAGFLMFEPAHFVDYMGPFPTAAREAGDDGLVGFVDGEGQLFSGKAAEIRRVLADYSFAADGSDAFFATEVMEFRGDRAGLERAIDSASRRFANVERGMHWKAREITTRWLSTPTPSSRASEREAILQELRDTLKEPEWVARFVIAWDSLGSDPDLGDLALDWLTSGGSDRREAGQIFNTLLTRGKFDRVSKVPLENPPIYVIELARRWIEAMDHPGNSWASLWQKLRRRHQIDRSASNHLGMRFLHVEPKYRTEAKRPTGASGWMRVWRTLWLEDNDRPLLVDMLPRHPELLGLGEFYRIIELLAAESRYSDMVHDYFGAWLERSPRHTPRWPRACLDLIVRYDDRDYFIGLALKWLRREGAGLHAWYGLWSGLRPYVGKDELVSIGREWLERSQITMRIWPEVLADIIEMDNIHSDERLRLPAQQWLQLGKRNGRRGEIEAFATRPPAYARRKETGPALFLSYHFADYWRVSQIRNRLLSDGKVRLQAVLESATWDDLKKDGNLAIETFLENQLRAASVTLVLFGTETASREWVRHEVMRSHQLGLGLIAIDIHRLQDEGGRAAKPGVNPLSLWQVEIDGKPRIFSEIYPTYDWIEDEGPRNIMNWIAEVAPRDHTLVTAAKLRD